jgi:TetR/AcrR family transcriptional regulator, tetracycline repressor protein
MAPRLDVRPIPATHPGWVDWFVPPPLTRRRIVHVALSLVDESGLRRLSLDRLAGHLGVKPAALRHHVRDRVELVELLVDHVHALVLQAAGPAGRAPRAEVRHVLDCQREVWLAHRPLIAAHHLGVLAGPAEDELCRRLADELARAGWDRYHAATEARLLLQYALTMLYGADDRVLDRRLAAIESRV